MARKGLASWFCCGNAWGPCGPVQSRGACGTCHSGRNQHAWPYQSNPRDPDACFRITRPDRCGKDLAPRPCGFRHRTVNICNGRSITTAIADCGPQTDLFCNERLCCRGLCRTARIIDFTPAAYSQLASLSSGVIPVDVHLP